MSTSSIDNVFAVGEPLTPLWMEFTTILIQGLINIFYRPPFRGSDPLPLALIGVKAVKESALTRNPFLRAVAGGETDCLCPYFRGLFDSNARNRLSKQRIFYALHVTTFRYPRLKRDGGSSDWRGN